MKPRTFRAKTMVDALRQVKEQLGRNALILSTRTLPRRRMLGLRGSAMVEITAVHGDRVLPNHFPPNRIRRDSESTDRAEGAAQSVSAEATHQRLNASRTVLEEIGSLKALVHDLARATRREQAPELPEGIRASDALFDAYTSLVQSEVAESLAVELVERIRGKLLASHPVDEARVRAELVTAIEKSLPTTNPITLRKSGEPTVIVLVGPTGVGKTTTIAKLAANFCLRDRRRVGLITIDTYRIAAVEQLKTYAQIIEVPLEVVTTPPELKQAVHAMADRELILIDTAGRSPKDSVKIGELRRFLTAVKPDETHLVLSSTCSRASLLDTMERFRSLNVNRVIFTKIDEALGFGVVLSCLHQASASLSYLTTGQGVPDDIETGQAAKLADLILHGFHSSGAGAAGGPMNRAAEGARGKKAPAFQDA